MLSLNVPVAVNCWVVVAGIDGFAGVTAMDTSDPVTTVSVVVPLTAPETALIVVVPCESALARPLELTVATAVFDDDQVTVPVRS